MLRHCLWALPSKPLSMQRMHLPHLDMSDSQRARVWYQWGSEVGLETIPKSLPSVHVVSPSTIWFCHCKTRAPWRHSSCSSDWALPGELLLPLATALHHHFWISKHVQVNLSCTIFAVEEENELFSPIKNEGTMTWKHLALDKVWLRWKRPCYKEPTKDGSDAGHKLAGNTIHHARFKQSQTVKPASRHRVDSISIYLFLIYRYKVYLCMHIAISPYVHSIEGAGVEKCKSRQWSIFGLIQTVQMPRNRFHQSNKAAPTSWWTKSPRWSSIATWP